MKKFLTLFLGLLLVAVVFTGCSEKDDSTGPDDNNVDPPALSQTVDVVMAIPDSASLVNYTFETVNYEGVDMIGYPLAQFMQNVREYDEKLEYTYEIVSEDGYSPRVGANPELTYAQFSTGYLLSTNKFRTFFPNDDITTAYDVKWTDHINFYRTITVINLDAEHINFQTGAIETEDVFHQAGDSNFYTDPGFKLTNFISEYITEMPADYSYFFTNSEGLTESYSWEEIEAGYWMPEQNKAIFIDADGIEILTRFKHLISIELVQ